ncbi:hypothetical protein Bca4012_067912 [Brassica carinata]|uniref:TF-B3 domain-containing protein n=1 Tax=Brassica carinata TaxID=52824 RepID=A0A8X7VS34_BRACI|nr:hypothetical protein Bca52824_020135 [Brassica carinata]
MADIGSFLFSHPLDPALIISKQLTKSDLEGNVKLPKQQTESVLMRMGGVTAFELQNGKEVVVSDLVEGDEYRVTLRCLNNTAYYFGDGWCTMKHSLDLEEGETLKLYWYQDQKIFVILNFKHTVL